jgi:7-carboxy-7-deazaguanine synthase
MDAVMEQVQSYSARYVVITGGEPSIHPELVDLTQRLKALGMHITIETNGTNFREGVACDLVSMSPKLKHSVANASEFPEEHQLQSQRRLNIESFQAWIDHHAYQLKFVFCSMADIAEIQELVALIDRDVPPDQILLMPEGIDTKRLLERSPDIVQACQQHGYRYCMRLHIDLFGNTKGT